MKLLFQNKLRTGMLLSFAILLSIFSGCSGDGGNSGPSVAVTNFTVTQENDMLRFDYATTGEVNTVQLYSVQGGTYSIVTETIENPFYVSIASLGLSAGDLASFALLARGSDNHDSEYFGPVSLTIAAFCGGPTDLQVNGYASWSANAGSPNAYYQVQYGSQGFTVGSGTTITTNSTSTSNFSFTAGQVYDVYVRGYCTTSSQFSDWEGPVTYFAENNQNVCTPPTNVGFHVEYNFFNEAVGATMTWTDTGNNSYYEFNLVGNNQSPTANAVENGTSPTITYISMTQNTDYDFYVRTRCLDGSFTGWVGPLNVNIGQ